MRIFVNAWFDKFARKEGIDDSALTDAVARADRGLVDADLGGGVIKQRIARPNAGKSGGYRSIIIFRVRERAVFVFGFPKSGQSNLSPREAEVFRKAARLVLAFSDQQMSVEVEAGRLREIGKDGQGI